LIFASISTQQKLKAAPCIPLVFHNRNNRAVYQSFQTLPNSQFSIALGNLKGQAARIDVLDVLGKVIWERNMPALPNMLLVGGIANGNYVVRVSTSSEVQTTKLIIAGE
jgi:hypothetical protein